MWLAIVLLALSHRRRWGTLLLLEGVGFPVISFRNICRIRERVLRRLWLLFSVRWGSRCLRFLFFGLLPFDVSSSLSANSVECVCSWSSPSSRNSKLGSPATVFRIRLETATMCVISQTRASLNIIVVMVLVLTPFVLLVALGMERTHDYENI